MIDACKGGQTTRAFIGIGRILFVLGVGWGIFFENAVADTFYVTSSLGIRSEYNDNLYLTPDNETADVISLLSPRINGHLVSPRKGLQFEYAPEFSFYQHYNQFNTLRHSLSASGWWDVSKHTRISVRDQFRYTEDPGAEPIDPQQIMVGTMPGQTSDTVQSQPMEGTQGQSIDSSQGQPADTGVVSASQVTRNTREIYYENTFGLEFGHQFSRFDDLALAYDWRFSENEEASVSDQTGHTLTAKYSHWPREKKNGFAVGIVYEQGQYSDTDTEPGYRYTSYNPTLNTIFRLIPERLDLEGDLEFLTGDYTDDTSRFSTWTGKLRLINRFSRTWSGNIQYSYTLHEEDSSQNRYEIHEPSIGIDGALDRHLAFSLSVGYFFKTTDTGSPSSSVSVNGNLTKNWRHGSVSVAGASGYGEEPFGEERRGFKTYNELILSGQYQPSKHSQIQVNVSGRKDDYTDPDVDRKDQSMRVGLVYSLQLKKWLSMTLELSHRIMDSTQEENDYVENRAVISIQMAAPTPFRF